MNKIFKSELYKLLCNKYLFFSFALIFIYSIIANILYYIDNINIIMLYQNFNEEFILLYLVLIIYLSSSIITDEFTYETITDLYNKKIIVPKIIICILYLFIIFIFSFLICYDISLFTFKELILNIKIITDILKSFIYFFPYILIIILITFNIALIVKKGNITIILVYLLYFGSEYLNNFILHHHKTKLYYFLTINFNFNKNYLINDPLPLYYSILYTLICIIILIIIAIFIFKNQKFKQWLSKSLL